MLTLDSDFDPGYPVSVVSTWPGEYSIVVWSGGDWCAYYDETGSADNDEYMAAMARYPVGTEITVTATVTYYNIPGAESQTFTGLVPVSNDSFDPGGRRVLGTVVLPDPGSAPTEAGGAEAPESVTGGEPIPGVEAGAPPSDVGGGDDETASPDEGSEDATTPRAGSDEGGTSYRRPLIAALAVALVIMALVLLRNTRFDDEEDTPEDVVAQVTSALLTNPSGMIEVTSDVLQSTADAESIAAAAASPSFEATGTATGAATLSRSVDVIAPNGTTLTVPEGSYPSGPTTTWHGAEWTPINIAERWYWAPTNMIEVSDAGVGFAAGSPKTVIPLPYSRFELTEPLVWNEPAPSGYTTRRSLPEGNYALGEVEVTPEGNVYPVWEYVDKNWKFHCRIRDIISPATMTHTRAAAESSDLHVIGWAHERRNDQRRTRTSGDRHRHALVGAR